MLYCVSFIRDLYYTFSLIYIYIYEDTYQYYDNQIVLHL